MPKTTAVAMLSSAAVLIAAHAFAALPAGAQAAPIVAAASGGSSPGPSPWPAYSPDPTSMPQATATESATVTPEPTPSPSGSPAAQPIAEASPEPTSTEFPPPPRYCRCTTAPDCLVNIVRHNTAIAVPMLGGQRHNVVPLFNLGDYQNEGLEESDAQSDCESIARAIELAGGRLRPPAVQGYRFTGNYDRISAPAAPAAAQQGAYYRDADGWYRLSASTAIPPQIDCPLTACLWTGREL